MRTTRTSPGQIGDKIMSRKIARFLRQNDCMYLHAPGTGDAVLGKQMYINDTENSNVLDCDQQKHYRVSHENKGLPPGLILRRIIKSCIPKIPLWFQPGKVISSLLCTAVLGSETLAVFWPRDNCVSVVDKILCFICYVVKCFLMRNFIINLHY